MSLVHHLRDVEEQLREVENQVDRITNKWRLLMATIQDFRNAIQDINLETNRISAVIIDLLDKIRGGGLTDVEEEEALASIRAAAEALKAVGATTP